MTILRTFNRHAEPACISARYQDRELDRKAHSAVRDELVERMFVLKDPQPRTLACVGDSRTGIFAGRLFTDTEADSSLLVQSRWHPHFRCAEFFGGETFSEAMRRMLWELRVLRVTEEGAGNERFPSATYCIGGAGGASVTYGFRVAPNAPPLLFSSIVDVWDLEEEWNGRFAVEADGRPAYFDRLPAYDARAELSSEEAERRIAERCAPLRAAIRALRDAGAPRQLVLGSTPPSPIPYDGAKPLRLRANVRYLFDRVMERWCDELGAAFVPIRDALSHGAERDERYFADAEHFNVDGACRVLETIAPLL